MAGGGHCLAGHPPAAQVLIPCRPVTKAILALQLHPALLDIACAEEKSCVESGGGDPGWTKKRGGHRGIPTGGQKEDHEWVTTVVDHQDHSATSRIQQKKYRGGNVDSILQLSCASYIVQFP